MDKKEKTDVESWKTELKKYVIVFDKAVAALNDRLAVVESFVAARQKENLGVALSRVVKDVMEMGFAISEDRTAVQEYTDKTDRRLADLENLLDDMPKISKESVIDGVIGEVRVNLEKGDKAINELQEKHDRVATTQEAMKHEVSNIRDRMGDLTRLSDSMVGTIARIVELEHFMQNTIEILARRKKVGDVRYARYIKLLAEVDALEKKLEAVGPGRIKTQVLAIAMSSIETKLDELVKEVSLTTESRRKINERIDDLYLIVGRIKNGVE